MELYSLKSVEAPKGFLGLSANKTTFYLQMPAIFEIPRKVRSSVQFA